jgi:uncharacterized membrane protein
VASAFCHSLDYSSLRSRLYRVGWYLDLLAASPGKSAEQMRRILLTGGVWLILLEVTVVNFAWAFSLSTYLQVIWAIGVSMICLGLLQGFSRACLCSRLLVEWLVRLNSLYTAIWEVGQ